MSFRVATINIDYANNTHFNQSVPLDSKPLNAKIFAEYCLYNRGLNNFGIDNRAYLAYEGGFVTIEDKINFKKSNLEITKTFPSNSSGGNFIVRGESSFLGDIDIKSGINIVENTIINVRHLESIDELTSTAFDKDPISIKDYKRFHYQPGMIIFYNGTWENLRDNMPFWRICAAPDAGTQVTARFADGQTEQITIPDLLGKFIPGARPGDINQTSDTNYTTKDVGGFDAISLNIDQVPSHNHDVVVTITGDEAPEFTGVKKFISGGKVITVGTTDYARKCAASSISCTCVATGKYKCRCTNSCPNDCQGDQPVTGCWRDKACPSGLCSQKKGPEDWTGCDCYGGDRSITWDCGIDRRKSLAGGAAGGGANSVTQVNINSYLFRTLKFESFLPVKTSETEDDIGNGQPHENRPKFYGLIPIIYVGVKR
jgi:hypothetical protein